MTTTQAESGERTQEAAPEGPSGATATSAGASPQQLAPPQPLLRRLRPQRSRRQGTRTTTGCVLLALVLQGHRWIPNTPGHLGSLTDTLLAHLHDERAQRVIVMGDFNGSLDDRALRPLTTRMTSAQSTAGKGFGLTWPSSFPVVRIDQILLKDVKATSAWNLPATTSDHIPVAARVDLGREKHTAGQQPAAARRSGLW
ncbi:endonuclease/exonuclease/phosphatase family protein [Streptomyces sp. NPDC051020]|uniref:endonuclease/exonuclease/phosphatase family protein n=1 Tax=Streptomyces sp. NPDC051020 TaxID=3155409 RepID=UPI003440F823